MQSWLTTSMPQNTLLTLGLVIASYLWSRSDFFLPRRLRAVMPAPRTALWIGGWAVLVIITIYSVGDLLSGRTQISDSASHYARRDLQPWRFWRQAGWQMSLGVLLGVSLIRLSRAGTAATLVPTERPSARV